MVVASADGSTSITTSFVRCTPTGPHTRSPRTAIDVRLSEEQRHRLNRALRKNRAYTSINAMIRLFQVVIESLTELEYNEHSREECHETAVKAVEAAEGV